jgi:CRP/FNR family transcriptional regulator, cyclic AMP receptor protein
LTSTEQAELVAVFARRGWLASQPADFRELVVSKGRVLEFSQGSPIYHEGSAAGGIFGLVSGGVGLSVGYPHLAPRTAHILRTGDWFGSGPILRGGNRSMGFTAIEPSRLLAVELAVLRQMGSDLAENLRRIGVIASMGAELGAQIVAGLLIGDSARRVAATLLRVTAVTEGVEPVDRGGFLLSQSLIAEMTNISRNRVNEVLQQLRQAGWIHGRYNRVRILDADGLAAFAYGDD